MIVLQVLTALDPMYYPNCKFSFVDAPPNEANDTTEQKVDADVPKHMVGAPTKFESHCLYPSFQLKSRMQIHRGSYFDFDGNRWLIIGFFVEKVYCQYWTHQLSLGG
jgi:hypothetical protein